MPAFIEERTLTGYTNGAVVEERQIAGYSVGLADSQVMVLEGLFDFPGLGELGHYADLTFAGYEGLGEVSPVEAVDDLKKTVARREATVKKADDEVRRLSKLAHELDTEIVDKLQQEYQKAVAARDQKKVASLELQISKKNYERLQAGKQVIRWLKLQAVARQMLVHAKSQIGIAILFNEAKKRGDKVAAAEFARQYKEIGGITKEMKALRKRQNAVWKTRTAADLVEAKQGSVDAIKEMLDRSPGNPEIQAALARKEKELREAEFVHDRLAAESTEFMPQQEAGMEAFADFEPGHNPGMLGAGEWWRKSYQSGNPYASGPEGACSSFSQFCNEPMLVKEESGRVLVWPEANTIADFLGDLSIGLGVDERHYGETSYRLEPGVSGVVGHRWDGEYTYELDPGVSGFWGKVGNFFKKIGGAVKKGAKWVYDKAKKLAKAACKVVGTKTAKESMSKYGGMYGQAAAMAASACPSDASKAVPPPPLEPPPKPLWFWPAIILGGAAVVGIGFAVIARKSKAQVRGLSGEEWPLAELALPPSCGCGG